MKLLNKHFLLGFVLGGVCGVAVLIGGVYAYAYLIFEKKPVSVSRPVLPMALEAEFDWSIQTLAGETHHFSEFKGTVIFLTFWRPGCPHCESELPFLQDLYDKIQDDDIAFVTVVVRNADGALDLIAELDLTFPIYTLEDDRPKMYKTGVPSTFIISPDGRIAFRNRGAARWNDDTSIAFMRGLADGEIDATYGLVEDEE